MHFAEDNAGLKKRWFVNINIVGHSTNRRKPITGLLICETYLQSNEPTDIPLMFDPAYCFRGAPGKPITGWLVCGPNWRRCRYSHSFMSNPFPTEPLYIWCNILLTGSHHSPVISIFLSLTWNFSILPLHLPPLLIITCMRVRSTHHHHQITHASHFRLHECS